MRQKPMYNALVNNLISRVYLSPKLRRNNFFPFRYMRMGLKTPPVNFFENPFMLTKFTILPIFSNIFLNTYFRANSTKIKCVLKCIFYKSARESLRSAAYFCHKRFFFTFSKMPFEHVVSMNGFSKKFTGGVFRPIRKYLYVKKLLRRSLGERNTLIYIYVTPNPVNCLMA